DPDVNSNVNGGRLGWVVPQRGGKRDHNEKKPNGAVGHVGFFGVGVADEENNPNAFVRLDGFLVQEVADRNDQLLSIVTPPSNLIGTTTTLSGHVNPSIP